MPEAIGSFTRHYEARAALRFAPAPQPPLTDAERQAMLERMLARAAALNGWPEGKAPLLVGNPSCRAARRFSPTQRRVSGRNRVSPIFR